MNGQRNIRCEKLLDLLDEIVDDKMWKKIINVERPNCKNYQHKRTLAAHKKAEDIIGKIELMVDECGIFKVQSSSGTAKYYCVIYNELCTEDCRTGYCHKRKICLHRYKCQCPENSIRSVRCKHIHAVALFEKRSDSVLGYSSRSEDEDDINHFIQESIRTSNGHLTFPIRVSI